MRFHLSLLTQETGALYHEVGSKQLPRQPLPAPAQPSAMASLHRGATAKNTVKSP
jgi:hypothetical protein